MAKLKQIFNQPGFMVWTLIAAASGAVLLTILAGVVISDNTRSLVSASEWVEHTQVVLNSLQTAAKMNDGSDFNARLYLVTGDLGKLNAARSDANQLDRFAPQIKALVHDNANEGGNSKDLMECSAELNQSLIALTPANPFPADKFQRCRQTIESMAERERALLRTRVHKSRMRSLVSLRTEAAFILLSVLTLISLTTFLVRLELFRQSVDRERSTNKLNVEHLNAALSKNEESFRGMIEASSNGMALTDAAGRIERVNSSMERAFRYTREELIGMPIDMLVPERFRNGNLNRQLGQARTSALPFGDAQQFYGLRKDGAEFPFEISFNPILSDNEIKVCSAIIDVSDRRQRELRDHNALKEKDVLLGEIHHRVKNNLQIIHSLLELQSGQITDPAMLAMLRDSQNRIKSMALIHQTLYQSKDFARVDFQLFLNSLVPNLVQSYLENAERIILTINAAGIHLPINTAIPCGLLVNELISNCLKHAFPAERRGKITVDLVREEEGDIVLTVRDNGIGIEEDLDITQTASLGLQLVFLLSDQVGGKMTVHRSNPTSFMLRFPLKEPIRYQEIAPSPDMTSVTVSE